MYHSMNQKNKNSAYKGVKVKKCSLIMYDLCGTNFRIGCNSSFVRNEKSCVAKRTVISYTPI